MGLFRAIGDQIVNNGIQGLLVGVAAVIGALSAMVIGVITLRRTGRVEDKAGNIGAAIGDTNGKGSVVKMNEIQLAYQEQQYTALTVATEVLTRRLDATDRQIGDLRGVVDQTNSHLVSLLLQNSNSRP